MKAPNVQSFMCICLKFYLCVGSFFSGPSLFMSLFKTFFSPPLCGLNWKAFWSRGLAIHSLQSTPRLWSLFHRLEKGGQRPLGYLRPSLSCTPLLSTRSRRRRGKRGFVFMPRQLLLVRSASSDPKKRWGTWVSSPGEDTAGKNRSNEELKLLMLTWMSEKVYHWTTPSGSQM